VSDEVDQPGGIELQEEIFRLAIDTLIEHAFVTLDTFKMVTTWSAGAERLFGYRREHAIGSHVSAMFVTGSHEWSLLRQDLQRAAQHGRVFIRRPLKRRDGSVRSIEGTIVALRTKSRDIGYAILACESKSGSGPTEATRDTQDRLAARVEDTTRQLAESHALLDIEIIDRTEAEAARIRLLRRLVVAQEEERRRIARDLHDDLGQQLTALRLTLEGMTASAGRSPELSTAIQEALTMLARIDQGLDFLAWELRPAALDELGLIKVLENYVREWSRHAGVRAMFHAGTHEIERFAPEVEASIYRIAQEALNNVAKHARAQSVNVLLEQREENLVLVVEDDGVGFRAAGPAETMIGLQGMRERAAAVGGTLEIEPTPDGGTTLLAQIPLAPPSSVSRAHPPVYEGVVASPAPPQSSTVSASSNPAVVSSLRARLLDLQHAVSARDEFIATVAHELRNPVSPLIFQLRLAIDKTEQMSSANEPIAPDWVQSQLRRMEQRLHRLLETLDRLLDVSRLSTGRIDLQPEPVNLGFAVREVLGSFDAELAVARCELRFVERRVATGSWDRVRLEQICRNLVSNAIRFGAGRPIEVVINADEDFATLEVRDHGVGIAPDQQARIFERFERGREQRSGGFGIGLWVVKNICAAMGGTISVESELGEGARFTVMLPRSHQRGFSSDKSE
jgi:PAS domain S-box-containing protein